MEQNFIHQCLTYGYLVSPDFSFDGDLPGFLDKLKQGGSFAKPLVLHPDLLVFLDKGKSETDLNWIEFEKSRALFEFGKDRRVYDSFLGILSKDVPPKLESTQRIETALPEPETDTGSVIVLNSYQSQSKKREVQDFVKYYTVRFETLRKMLLKRAELQNVLSINRVLSKGDGDVSFIGIVSNKRSSKKGNILLTVEDVTGQLEVIVPQNKKELFEIAKETGLDEVIGVQGGCRGKFVFCNNLLCPDIPLDKELKKADEEVYVAFTADLHVGSYLFYKEDFLKFVDWINGNSGNEKQKAIAKKVKYLFLVGDLVDGVGIYPRQEEELLIKDIYEQYALCAELVGKIRKDLHIVICGGNHDAIRLAEPQPILDKDLAKGFHEMPNVTLVTNPALVSIHAKRDFEGLKVLLYHGYSFQYYADSVDTIRASGGNYRADLIMKYLLQRRHLAPSHTATLFIPDTERDPLIIDDVPDFFVTGHIHRTAALNYRNVTMIGCSCWVGRTSFMEKVGIHPDPSRITLVNLQTREIKIMKFRE